MRPIQIMMDEKDLKLLDLEARRQSTDRSKLMREAVRRYLAKLAREAAEQEYVRSYRRKPMSLGEVRDWQKVQAWPEE